MDKSPLEAPPCPECASKSWSAGEYDCTEGYGCYHSTYTCNECFYTVDHVYKNDLFDAIEEVLRKHYE